MALNNFDEDQFDQEDLGGGEFEPEPQKPRGNRTFLIAIAIIGILFVVALILLLLVAPGILAKQRAAQQEQAAQIIANNTATAMAATSFAQQQQTLAAVKTSTPTPTVVVSGGSEPTKTPVVVIQRNTPEASGGSGLSDAELATVSALKTLMAAGGVVSPTPTSTALPTTGAFDNPQLLLSIGIAIVLVAIIVVSRRLRLNER
jgi:hypothetical protein